MDDAAALLSALAQVLATVIWPAVVIVVVFRFSKEVRGVLRVVARRIENAEKLRFAMGAASAELSGIVERSAEIARDIVLRVVPPESRTSRDDAEEALVLAESANSPTDRVTIARDAVADRMRRVLRGIGQNPDGLSFERLASELRQRGKISPDVETSVVQLSTLAGIVQDSGPAAPNQRAASAFISLAEAVLQALPAD